MLKRVAIIVAAPLLILIGLKACWSIAFPTNSFRYKLTVEVNTPDGVKSGFSVIEVFETKQPRGFAGGMGIVGEAVTVDLGARGQIFVLLKNGSREEGFNSEPGSIVYSAFPRDSRPGHRGGEALPENLKRYRSEHLVAPLRPEQMPLMVRFLDPRDPKTVSRVDPTNIAASFGPGYGFKSATLETTRDSATAKIIRFLPWLVHITANLDGSSATTSNTLSNTLGVFEFKRGA